ncbi:MAG: glycosyltransferase [Candidatus Omnitrophota bacterium]
MNKISVILPAFNERGNIVFLIRAIHNELGDSPHEILVVDDQSPDGTAQAVIDMRDSASRLITRDRDHGYAKSIRCGIEQAAGDILIIMDSDFNHSPRYIPQMVEMLSRYSCVSASRFLNGGQMVPAWRGISSRIFNIFVRRITGGRMTDNLYGFFGLKREALKGCPFDDIFWGFGDYAIRLLFYLQKNKVNISEFPAVCGQRLSGLSRMRYFHALCLYTKETLALAGKGRIQ